MKFSHILSTLTLSTILSSSPAFSATNAEYKPFSGEFNDYKQSSGKVVGAYVANWSDPSIVDSINGDNLTHILYAFLTICGDLQLDKAKTICENKEDFQLVEDETSIDKTFSAKFLTLKNKYEHLNILPSVGGWGGSDMFVPMSATAENRAVFVQSVVDFLKNNPAFSGIDIDWEWPSNYTEGENYALLMIDLREAFDLLEQGTERKYQITSAIGTHLASIQKTNYAKAAPHMDYIFMMTYDFFGGWSKANVGHHTQLEAHTANGSNNSSGKEATQNLINAGVPAEKLVLGVAKYARGFDGVELSSMNTVIGGTAAGLFPKKVQPSHEEGVARYSRLVNEIIGADGSGINGFEVVYDDDCKCHFAWRESDKAFVAFDHPEDILAKGKFSLENNLGGLFSWEYGQDNGDLLNAMNEGVGNLMDDISIIDNPLWSVGHTYVKGSEITHDGITYVARWGNRGKEPGQFKAWTEVIGKNWLASIRYVKGDEVTYNDVTYVARWKNMGKQPDNSGVWRTPLVGNTNWVSHTKYSKGDEITHDGIIYVARWGNLGKIPGESAAWTVVE
jgi:chitinase